MRDRFREPGSRTDANAAPRGRLGPHDRTGAAGLLQHLASGTGMWSWAARPRDALPTPPRTYRRTMRIAVIGPLEVLAEDSAPVAVPGAEERMLLAVLAAAAPDLVGIDRLIEELWKGDPPEAARECLQVRVAHLRSALEPGHPENSSGQYVLRRGAGYVLAVGAGDIDAHRIGALAARGRAQLAAGDAAGAVRLLTAALGLWRGEPFDEWLHAAFADEERRRLADVRADASAGLAAARLQLAVRPEVGAVARKLPAPVITAAHPGPGPPAQVPAPRSAPTSVDGPRQELRDEADDPA